MSATRDVITFAGQNDGVFTTQEASALGMTRPVLVRHVEHGVFVRIGRGVLSLPGTSTRPDLLLRAAHRIVGGVVSHESAARLHGFAPLKEHDPTITVSHRSTHRFSGVTVHQSTDLLETHVTVLRGLRVTTAERTLIDLAQTTGARRLERMIDNALAGQLVAFEELAALHSALARKGKPGTKKLRLILEGRGGSPPLTETELESRLFRLIEEAGLPAPVRQFSAPWLRPVQGRVDLAYVDACIVIEADSRRWHTMFDAFEIDRRRDNAAQLAGWMVLRFTWRMIADEPATVVSTIREALAGPRPRNLDDLS